MTAADMGAAGDQAAQAPVVEVDGVATTLDPSTSLRALIEARAGSVRGAAAVVDGTVVPRGEWESLQLRAGMRIEIIKAVQGG